MGMILSYTASCGAAVNFSDEGYINSSEQELAFRRENMRSTAEQIAQETQLRHICQENRDECPETAKASDVLILSQFRGFCKA